ncbi:hypothetical protein ES708_05980 [subsurface metagenome]
MSVRLSQQKVTRLLKYYFAGMTQPVIAQKLGIDQSSVSLYAKRFSERAAEIGLLKAAKEYNVYKEVSELRNLSVEMHKLNLTSNDAKKGTAILRAFDRLNVQPEQHSQLIQVCKKINDPEFVKAALELARIEKTENISYERVIPKFETILLQLPLKQNELAQTQTQLNSFNRSMIERKRDLKNVNTRLKQVQDNARVKREGLERDYEVRRQQLQVYQGELETVVEVKAVLKKDDLDIETFALIVKEYRSGTQQVQGILIRRDFEKHHSFRKSLEAMIYEVASKKQESTRLTNKNLELNQLNDRVITETAQNERNSVDASFELSQLLIRINRLRRQYELFQGFLAVLSNSPSANGPIESLITTLHQIVRVWWYSSASIEERIGHFMKYVFGDYLQSYKCDHCGGSRFMVSRGADKAYTYYRPYCPVCHSSNWVKPDDSFLRAMVSEEQLENTYKAEQLMEQNGTLLKIITILKPFHVLIGMPCEVCGELITDWTEDKAKEFATGIGWMHQKCRKTLTGVMKQLGLVSEYIPRIEEKSSQQKKGEVIKQPVIKLTWPGW